MSFFFKCYKAIDSFCDYLWKGRGTKFFISYFNVIDEVMEVNDEFSVLELL